MIFQMFIVGGIPGILIYNKLAEIRPINRIFSSEDSMSVRLVSFSIIALLFSVSGLLADDAPSDCEGDLILRKEWKSGGSSVETVNSRILFTAYPNPASNFLTVKISKELLPCKMRIIDLSGNSKKTENLSSQSETASVNISDLSRGVYLIEVNHRNTKQSQLFIKY